MGAQGPSSSPTMCPARLFAATAGDPVMLYRLSLAVRLADVQKAEPVRPEQPLVRRGNQKVRSHLLDVERMCSERLYPVYHERRPDLPGALPDAHEIHERPVRPVAVR